ncbi:CBO0543 family protein [Paenibacillus solisilvae]|uniref:CBO0543 family protein n=1 Tax=Paenibacillus solisilvae TaxID=2486751 RepID=A0ABW0W6A4_9BACL
MPRNQFRLAQVAILFKQVITWLFGLFVVELGWIEYPVRELESVNRTRALLPPGLGIHSKAHADIGMRF